ncbi:dispersed gene family protein 1 (DGF-1) [Trypanosoma cruzi]|nr:dispersed gene family protein 1 (DGF-1) [Trypanosoma cruzi]
MTLGALLRTAQRSSARETAGYSPVVSGQFRVATFPFLDALPSSTSLLEANSGAELEERIFRAFDVTTWPSRIWDEGISGVVVDLRGAYKYWQRADDQAQLSLE